MKIMFYSSLALYFFHGPYKINEYQCKYYHESYYNEVVIETHTRFSGSQAMPDGIQSGELRANKIF